MSRPLILVLVMLVLFVKGSYAQLSNAITFEQLDSLQKIEERPVLVFIHTDWCRYCQAMKHTTFQNKEVSALLNSAFYTIALDAEGKQDITVKGQTFRYQPSGNGTGQHELAQVLGRVEGELTFPTLCFLNADYEIIYQQSGFLKDQRLSETLKIIQSKMKSDAL